MACTAALPPQMTVAAALAQMTVQHTSRHGLVSLSHVPIAPILPHPHVSALSLMTQYETIRAKSSVPSGTFSMRFFRASSVMALSSIFIKSSLTSYLHAFVSTP